MENQKTIEEWLNELEDPFKSKALYNAKNHSPVDYVLGTTSTSLSNALHGAFYYSLTKEGHDYWWNKLQKLKLEGK